MMLCLLWLIVGLLFLFLELFTPTLFFFVSFFLGSLGASLLSYFEFSLLLQISSFFGIALVSIVLLFVLLKKSHYFGPKHGAKTNFFALQGKHAEVIKEIKPIHIGLIKVGGEIWSARGKESDHFAVGSVVEIIDVIGCHCIVRLVQDYN